MRVVYSLFYVAFLSQAFPVIPCPGNNPVNVIASLKPGWKYTIKSPGFPNNYPHNTTCYWNITGTPLPGYRIYLILNDFQIEPSRHCDKDYLVTTDSWYQMQWRTSGYCSVLTPNYIKSLSYQERNKNRKITYFEYTNMWVKFASDGSSEFKGFQGEIRLVAPRDDEDCQSYLNEASGSFASPKHPSVYPPQHHCTWHITVPDGKKARLKFTVFELENTTNKYDDCSKDFVEIREGVWNEYGEILGRFCGDTLPPQVISSSNKMWVRFVSDGDYTSVYKGFRAEFSGSTVLVINITTIIFVLLSTFWL